MERVEALLLREERAFAGGRGQEPEQPASMGAATDDAADSGPQVREGCRANEPVTAT